MRRFMLRIAALTAIVCAFALPASAIQIKKPVEGENLVLKISAKESTRFVVEGGRIKSFLYKDGDLILEKDEERGQVFITPVILDKPLNVRVITGENRTFGLVLQAVDMPQEDVVLQEDRPRQKTGPLTADASERSVAVRAMIRSLASEDLPSSMDCEAQNQEVLLWEGTQFVLEAICREREFESQRYSLKNTSNEVIRLEEQEFFRKGVAAVAIEKMAIPPGGTSRVFVVKEP